MRRHGLDVPRWKGAAFGVRPYTTRLAAAFAYRLLRRVFAVLMGFTGARFFWPDSAFLSSRNFHAVRNAPANTYSFAAASRM